MQQDRMFQTARTRLIERQRALAERIAALMNVEVPGWVIPAREEDTTIDDGGGYGLADERPEWLQAEDY